MACDKIPSERISEIGWDDIEVGETQAENYELTEEVYGHFLALSGDTNPIHVSDEEAVQRGFLKKVMHGVSCMASSRILWACDFQEIEACCSRPTCGTSILVTCTTD